MSFLHRLASQHTDLLLSYYGLDKILSGEKTTLYHGTTASFRRFDISKSRKKLVNDFYGPGIFLTPKKVVAGKYAYANRNIGLPPEIIRDYQSVDRDGAAWMRTLFERGDGAWDNHRKLWEKVGDSAQTISDVADWIIGTKTKRPSSSSGFQNIFSTSTGMPDYVYEDVDSLGIDGDKYRPKVYTVILSGVKHPLVTDSQAEARKARRAGYDCVVYYGPDLVDDVPEVAVFDASLVRVTKVEVW